MDKKLEIWLDIKKEIDYAVTTEGSDPYVTNETDIFTEWEENDGSLRSFKHLLNRLAEKGVDEA